MSGVMEIKIDYKKECWWLAEYSKCVKCGEAVYVNDEFKGMEIGYGGPSSVHKRRCLCLSCRIMYYEPAIQNSYVPSVKSRVTKIKRRKQYEAMKNEGEGT